MTSRREDWLPIVAQALDEVGARWMLIGDAAHALLGLAPWPEEGCLHAVTDKVPRGQLPDDRSFAAYWCTGGHARWLVLLRDNGVILVADAHPTGYLDQSSLARTTRIEGLPVAPPEYLLFYAARHGSTELIRALAARSSVDWSFLEEVFERDLDRLDAPEWARTADNLDLIRPGLSPRNEGIPAPAIALLESVRAELDAAGAPWMVTGAAARALREEIPWPGREIRIVGEDPQGPRGSDGKWYRRGADRYCIHAGWPDENDDGQKYALQNALRLAPLNIPVAPPEE